MRFPGTVCIPGECIVQTFKIVPITSSALMGYKGMTKYVDLECDLHLVCSKKYMLKKFN